MAYKLTATCSNELDELLHLEVLSHHLEVLSLQLGVLILQLGDRSLMLGVLLQNLIKFLLHVM